MINKKFALTAVAAVLSLSAGFAAAAPLTDVQDFSNNTSTEYFLDVDANKYSSPYYRNRTQDWGWQHGAIAGTITSAMLEISAFDVDAPAEQDVISVWTGSSWLGLGSLAGANSTWAFSSFDLTSYLSTWATTEINNGLQVAMNIDSLDAGWIVTLAKSTLHVDGGSQQCVPQPGVPCNAVPEPTSLALLGLGALGFAASRRKKAA